MDTDAGWSSSVARWAHNPEVAGSNPAPATNPQVRGPSSGGPLPFHDLVVSGVVKGWLRNPACMAFPGDAMGPVVPCETWRDTGDGLTGDLWAWPQRSRLLVAGHPPSHSVTIRRIGEDTPLDAK